MKTFTRIEPTTVQEVGDKFKGQVVVKRFKTNDGLEHEFTTFAAEGLASVAVLGLTSENQVIIARQFRPGPERICYEIPGGGVEEGEDLETAARRELFEETGYEPGAMTYIGVNSWDAYSNHKSHYFLATNCSFVGEPTRDKVEVDQGVETVLISVDQLIENAKTDKMTDAVAVLMVYDTLKELERGQDETTN